MAFSRNDIQQRWFNAGSGLGSLAVLLMLLSPWLAEVHLAASGPHHDLCPSHATVSSCHRECCHGPGSANDHQGEVRLVGTLHPSDGDEGHDSHQCPTCQNLRILSTPFSLPTTPSLFLPSAADRNQLSSLDSDFLPHFLHASQPRAPPVA